MASISMDELLQASRSIFQKLNIIRTDYDHLMKFSVSKKASTTLTGSSSSSNSSKPSTDIKKDLPSAAGYDGKSGLLAVAATASSGSDNSSNLCNAFRMLMLGMEDASCTAQLIIQLQLHEADRQRAKTQVQRLTAENKWLRDELSRCRDRLSDSEQSRMKLEVQLEHLKFCDSLDRKHGVESNNQLDINESSNEPHDDIGSSSNYTRNNSQQPTSTMCNSTLSTINNNSTFGNAELYSSELTPKLRALHNLVVHYASTHRYDVAVPLCRQTLEDLENSIGRNHPDVATMLNILALVYRDQSKYGDASQLLKEALSIRERCFGPDSPAVAATLNNLAVLQGRRGKYKDAESLCRRALAIRIKNLGADHTDVAKQLVNLALICLHQGKFQDTFSDYERAISIYKERLGHNDAIVLRTQISLASAYIRADKSLEGERLLRDTILPCVCSSSSSTTVIDGMPAPNDLRFDSHLLLSAAKTLLNLLRSKNLQADVSRLESLLSGSGQMNDIVAFLKVYAGCKSVHDENNKQLISGQQDCTLSTHTTATGKKTSSFPRRLLIQATKTTSTKNNSNALSSSTATTQMSSPLSGQVNVSGEALSSLRFAKLRATIRICSASLLPSSVVPVSSSGGHSTNDREEMTPTSQSLMANIPHTLPPTKQGRSSINQLFDSTTLPANLSNNTKIQSQFF